MSATLCKTTARLSQLRSLMKSNNLSAYVVPTEDAHMSEYIADCDQRRQFISNFTGSSGTAVVPIEGKALLWTDGRYFLQAAEELDENWKLIKDRLTTTIPVEQWLAENLPKGSFVGVDPTVFSWGNAQRYRKCFSGKDIRLKATEKNLVDQVWGDERPAVPSGPIKVHPLSYAGESVDSKISKCREHMKECGADALAVAALDEVAWLLNIRGSDVPYNPVVVSYALITLDDVRFYVDECKLKEEAKTHLEEKGVVHRPYTAIFEDLRVLSEKGKKIWVDPSSSSMALAEATEEPNRLEKQSPIALMKACKNETELSGLRNAHIRDGAALVSFFAWLDHQCQMKQERGETKIRDEGKGDKSDHVALTEVTVSDKLEQFRSAQEDFVSLSFPTISGSGSNGAVIHYHAKRDTAAPVGPDRMYLCDSGGQYKDGTTDVTRTLHFGTPTDFEKRCFTRVLQGHIALGTVVFPHGTSGHKLDILARLPLYMDGLDYRHGTGHGVGAFLNVHEGPQGISGRSGAGSTPLLPGMTMTNEPGYYQDGDFGIRIENVMIVTEAKTPHNFADKKYYTFETITMHPIQTKLIEESLLSDKEIHWVNEYNQEVFRKLSPLVDEFTLNYLKRETAPIAKR